MHMASHWRSEGWVAYPPRCGGCANGPGESCGLLPADGE